MSRSEDAPLVLIADDQRDVREALRLLLKGEGYRTESASSPAAPPSRRCDTMPTLSFH